MTTKQNTPRSARHGAAGPATWVAALGGVMVLLGASASLQTDPRTLPAVEPAGVRYVGSFAVPREDGAGSGYDHTLMYGGYALGIGPDGKSLYFGCHDYSDRIARVSIAEPGGTASVIEPCQDVPGVKALPGSSNGVTLGGSVWWNGRIVVSAYTYYTYEDQKASHWYGAGLSTLTGPVGLKGDLARRQGGLMVVVPPEWRAALGGPVLTGQCCLAVISNSSFGQHFSVFDPANLGASNASKTLLSYPEDHPTLGTFDDVGGLESFGQSTRIAGAAFPVGTSSVLLIGMQGSKRCYGGPTDDPALHGKVIGGGNTQIWCFDPTGGGTGPHGYPYIPALWVYKASDLADVAAGRKRPWTPKPTSITRLPGTLPERSEFTSATYDPVTRRIYATMPDGTNPTVYVWEVAAPAASKGVAGAR